MKCGEYQPFGTHSLIMHSYRYSPSVVLDCCRAVCLESHPDLIAETRKMFINGVIDYLIDQMIEAFGRNAADIHSRTFPDSLKPLKHSDAAGIIDYLICHIYTPTRL